MKNLNNLLCKGVTFQEDDHEKIWSQSIGGEKFSLWGFWGLRAANHRIILDAQYDQIELCKDFIYTRQGDYVTVYHSCGMVDHFLRDENDLRFYENGKIGLKDKVGNVRFPPIYDMIKEWSPYDVVYVINEHGFHYYDSEGKELFTDYEPIEGSDCEDEPFYIDEKQSTGVLVVRHFVDEPLKNNCCRLDGKWVEFKRIPCRDLKAVLGECEVSPMPKDALAGFKSKSTYIYEAFEASSRQENPVEDIIAQLTHLDAYRKSWRFITKVTISRNTKVTMETLKKFWLMYSNNSNFYQCDGVGCHFAVEDWMRIGIGYDDTLHDDEVKVFQVHYFTDRWLDFVEQRWVSALRHSAVPELQEIKAELDEFINGIRERKGDEAANTIHAEILEGGHISGSLFTELALHDELAKYDYLKSLGYHCLDTLWYLCCNIVSHTAGSKNERWVPLTKKQLTFCKAKMIWLVRNGTFVNYVGNRMTALDLVSTTKQLYEYEQWPDECQLLLTEMEQLLRRHGARYAREFDLDDLFWLEYKPGWRDERQFSIKPYTIKVSIGDPVTTDDGIE